ncbi:hypothetical protein TWF730_008895 [Orbilia blumenaviensis]|uniref:Transposase n=1 Tax=Orbilia blumenaviensis TaxID=1796055 RepID=A0AAV9V0T0_9PEZI
MNKSNREPAMIKDCLRTNSPQEGNLGRIWAMDGVEIGYNMKRTWIGALQDIWAKSGLNLGRTWAGLWQNFDRNHIGF